MWKRYLLISAALIMAAFPATAQKGEPQKEFRYNHNYYAMFGVGACQHRYTNISVGGGAEGFLTSGVAVGAEFHAHRFLKDISYGTGSLNLVFHFVDRTRPKKVDPYVIPVGFGFAVADGGGRLAVAIGGGMTYWFKPKMGLRTEFRLHVMPQEVVPMFRIGVSFR